MIVVNNKETLNEIKKNIAIIQNAGDKLSNLMHLTYCEQKAKDMPNKDNPYIVKSIIKYLAQGLDLYNAKILTALDFDETPSRVDVIYNSQRHYLSAIKLYARRYLCIKLKKNGFKTKEIAKILNVSENYVYKLHNTYIEMFDGGAKTKIKIKTKSKTKQLHID